MVDEAGGRAHVNARTARFGRIAAEVDMQQIRATAERRLAHVEKALAEPYLAQGETVAKRITFHMLQRIGKCDCLQFPAAEERRRVNSFHVMAAFTTTDVTPLASMPYVSCGCDTHSTPGGG